MTDDDTSVSLGNDGVNLEATVLYADLADSTALVDRFTPKFAAEIYKSFLRSAGQIIRSCGGQIVVYDGDRIMAVFLAEARNSSAVTTALKLKGAVLNVVQPALEAQYGAVGYKLHHVVGIDTSRLFVAKTGVRGATDLVWVGRAANYAAKLLALPHAYACYITADVFADLPTNLKIASDGTAVWQAAHWDNLVNRIVYRSNCTLPL